MASKGKTGSLGLWAFIAMCLNAVAWILKLIENVFKFSISIGGRSLPNLITAVASLALSIVALLVAHDFAEKQTKVWRIIYWVLAIATICAILFGIGYSFV